MFMLFILVVGVKLAYYWFETRPTTSGKRYVPVDPAHDPYIGA